MGKTYKYTTRLQAFARAVPEIANKKQVAEASLNDLVNVFRLEDLQKRILQNPDLLFWASNLILLDYANLNDDCVRKQDALLIYKLFQLKLCDIEHNREDIVGAIYDAGFSFLANNQMISAEEAAASEEVIQLVIGGYLWRIVCPELCDSMEIASLENSPSYGDISTSFELAFDDYDIGLGKDGDRNVNNATIITSEDKDFKKYDKMLRRNGGTGISPANEIVFRILKGDILPLGAGIVAKPASGLKGVKTMTLQDIHNAAEIPAAVIAPKEPIADCPEFIPAFIEDDIQKENNINQPVSSVTDTTATLFTMKIKSLDELASHWGEIKKLETAASVVTDLKEVAEANVRQQIEDAIAVKSEEFAKELQTQKDAAKASADLAKTNEDKAKELESTVEAMKKELDAIKHAQALAAAEDAFNARMDALNAEFELDDEDRALLVEDIRACPDDETFAKFMKKQEKLLAAKKKNKAPPFVKTEDKEKQDKEEKEKAEAAEKARQAEAARIAQEALASATALPNQSISNTSHAADSLKAQYLKAFSEGTTIGNKAAKDVILKKE